MLSSSPLTQLTPQEQIALIMQRIYQLGMTTLSGGNISIKNEDNSLWITPAATDKGNLHPHQIVNVNPTHQSNSSYRPSSEYPFHRAIYDTRPDIHAILHAHAPAIVTFSLLAQTPNTQIFPSSYQMCNSVGFAPYAPSGSQELGKQIAAIFEKNFNCIVMENHGLVTAGKNLWEAFVRLEILEMTAQSLLEAAKLTPAKLTFLSPKILEKTSSWTTTHPPTKQIQKEKELFDPEEEKKRSELLQFIQRAYLRHLFFSAGSSFSYRLSSSDFLMTPLQTDPLLITPNDLLHITQTTPSLSLHPEAKIHALIYQKHPEIQTILTSQPPHLAAHLITHTPLDTHTLPESHLILKNSKMLPYETSFENPKIIPEALDEKTTLLLILNRYALTVGKTPLEALNRLEVAESSATSLLNRSSALFH